MERPAGFVLRAFYLSLPWYKTPRIHLLKPLFQLGVLQAGFNCSFIKSIPCSPILFDVYNDGPEACQ